MEVRKKLTSTLATILALAGASQVQAQQPDERTARSVVLPYESGVREIPILSSGCYGFANDTTKFIVTRERPEPLAHPCVSQLPGFFLRTDVLQPVFDSINLIPFIEHRFEQVARSGRLLQGTGAFLFDNGRFSDGARALWAESAADHKEHYLCAQGSGDATMTAIYRTYEVPAKYSSDTTFTGPIRGDPCPGAIVRMHTHIKDKERNDVFLVARNNSALVDSLGPLDRKKIEDWYREEYAAYGARTPKWDCVMFTERDIACSFDLMSGRSRATTRIVLPFTNAAEQLARAQEANKTPPMNEQARLSLASYTTNGRSGNALDWSFWQDGVRVVARGSWTGDRSRRQFPVYNDYIASR